MRGIVGGEYRDETRVLHMLQALERIVQETSETSRDRLFFDDCLTRAIILDFIVLGEAANNVTEDYCAAHPEVPWSDIAGFRHKLVHDYSGIDFGILWDAMTKEVKGFGFDQLYAFDCKKHQIEVDAKAKVK